jgi:hypothetical protein
MAYSHGKSTAFQLDGTAGTLTNLGQYTDSVEGLPGEVELADVTTFGNEGHRNIPGLENASVSLSGNFDPAVQTLVGSTTQMKAATRSFEYGPAGGTTGMPKLSGEAWIQAFTINSGVSDKTTWSMTLQVDGVVTLGTYA